MAYELVELTTANVVGFYETERDALADVVEAIERDGLTAVETLALGFNDPDGAGGHAIAEGEALANRALAEIRGSIGNGSLGSSGKGAFHAAEARSERPN